MMKKQRYQYVSGKPRKIAFKVKLFKEPVGDKVHWLRSLLYPEHAGAMLKNAPFLERVLPVLGHFS